MTPVNTLADLKALTSRPDLVTVGGYATVADGGGGVFYWVTEDTTPANDGLIVQCDSGPPGRYKRLFTGAVCPKWWGCGLGAADDSGQFAKVIAAGYAIDMTATSCPLKGLTINSTTTCPGIFSNGGGTITAASGSTSATIIFTVTKSDFYVDGIFFDLPISTDPNVAPLCNRAVWMTSSSGSRFRISNSRFRGGRYGPFIGGISDHAQITNNVVTEVWEEGISLDASTNSIISGNILSDGGYVNTGASGAIRIGGSTQTVISENIVITNNNISRWSAAYAQEGIDCFCGGARNVIVCDNIIDGCGNGGIELKTQGTGVLSPDVYQRISVSGNVIRMQTVPPTSSIGIAMNFGSGAAAPASKAAMVVVEDNLVSCDAMPATGTSIWGVTLNGYCDTTIRNNQFTNIARGIALSGLGPTGSTAVRLVITGNTVYAVDAGVTAVGGTITGIQMMNNNFETTTGRCIRWDGAVINNAYVAYNRIVSGASYAIELRDVHDSSFAFNKIEAALDGVISQVSIPTGIIFNNNQITTIGGSAGHAFNLGTGIFTILNNQINIPITRRVIAGSATVTAAGNMRGTVTADPSATTAGSAGDMFLNSAVVSGGFGAFVCTTAGNAGAAAYKGTWPVA